MTGAPASLDRLEKWMIEALRFPNGAAADAAGEVLAASPRLNVADGLAIYQRSYFQRIARCMREQFPALCHALGTPLFDDFVAEYIAAYPPESYTLYDLGRRFPAYLRETRPDRDAGPDASETWVEFMIDLATFERELFVLFDAPGHEGRPFAAIDSPDDRLRLQPCFALGSYGFPVAVYYHEVRNGRDPAPPPLAESHVALTRVDYLTRTVLLSRAHFVFLQAMKDGGSVADALGTVSDRLSVPLPEVRRSWAADDGVRRRWIEAGFFVESGGA